MLVHAFTSFLKWRTLNINVKNCISPLKMALLKQASAKADAMNRGDKAWGFNRVDAIKEDVDE